MHTDAFIDEVRKVADSLKVKPPLVIQGEELREKGFGGIYGVGKAAVHQVLLLKMHYAFAIKSMLYNWTFFRLIFGSFWTCTGFILKP